MATAAESHVVGLILDQQVCLRGRVRLVATHASDLRLHFAYFRRIHHVRNRVTIGGVSQAVLEWKLHDTSEIVFRQANFGVEDRDQMRVLELLRLCVRAMAFQAKLVNGTSAQQVLVVAAVTFVAGRAALQKGWLVMDFLLAEFCDISVATEADVDSVGLRQTRLRAGVRIVAIEALASLCSRMGHLRSVDLFGLLVVAPDAQCLRVFLCQDNLPVLCRRMAHFARLVGERRMLELRHQFGGG